VSVGCCINNDVRHLAASPRELSVRRVVIALFIAVITATTYIRVSSCCLPADTRGERRVEIYRNNPLICTNARALDDIPVPLVHGRNTRKVDDTPRLRSVFVLRNCTIDRELRSLWRYGIIATSRYSYINGTCLSKQSRITVDRRGSRGGISCLHER